MATRHYYERRYYYRFFKKGLDHRYKTAASSSLMLGFFALIWSGSFLLGVLFFSAAVCYHAYFIRRLQNDLARFWGEDDELAFLSLCKLTSIQYGIFLVVLFIFGYGAFSEKGTPTKPNSSPINTSSPAPSQSSLPAKTYSELSDAMGDARARFAERIAGTTIYTTSDAYVRSYELRNNRPVIRVRINGKIGYVFENTYETTLRAHGFEKPTFEIDYGK